MADGDEEIIRQNPSETTADGTVPAIQTKPVHVAGRKHQFSIATLLVLQLMTGILAFVTKACGPGVVIFGLLVFVVVAIPIAGTVWVASHFQEAHQVGKKIGLASILIYGIGVLISYVVVWLYG